MAKRGKDKNLLPPHLKDLIKVDKDETIKRMEKHKIKFRPEETKKGKIWCPYCGAWTEISKGDYDRLKCCGISTNDFHVKNENNLW